MKPKVIPHKKPKREPKPYTPPKPKRYAVEKRVLYDSAYRWTVKEDYHFASNAKRWARYWEAHLLTVRMARSG